MAERVLQATASIPAGTPLSAPAVVSLPFDNWEVERIDLEVHAGPNLCLGFYLANNGQPWIPRTPGQWLTWDDRVESFTPTGYPTASGWQIVGYNVGQYAHAVVVRFHVNPVTVAARDAVQPIVLTFVEHDVKHPDPVVL